ncbi:hypothetical protein GCM10027290_38730 [Micromonospora sonneratiae]|uniref:Aromatic acid exporter family protein n=1 Tax=Micromonospora sonneratiae TaxID=1184706 RepID=A0ABW3Y7X1_9ACTN
MVSFRAPRRVADLSIDVDTQRIQDALETLRRRGRATGRDRIRRLRIYLLLAVQAGVAAALAWTIAHEVLGNPEPVFAPASAVALIAASVGQRLRRTVELMAGVVIGIAVGDVLIELIGTGPWQTGLIVSLAIIVAILLKGSGSLMTQAGGTAVLIASLSPSVRNLEVPRFIDATVGALVGMVVVLLLLPLNPLRLVERRASPTLDLLANQLAAAATALRAREGPRAERTLGRLNGADPALGHLSEAVQGAKEVVTLSPVRWRRRQTLAQYSDGVEHMERAFRDSRGMVRRIATMIREDESVPVGLPTALDRLGEAVRMLHREFLDGKEPERARVKALQAVGSAGAACAEGLGFHGTVVAAQIRTIAHDLLRATGLDRADARRLVRTEFRQAQRATA